MKEKEGKKIRYCSYCGAKMIRTLRYAEENMVQYGLEGSEWSFDSPYDEKTGKRNYCPYYKCPNYKQKKWYQLFSPHDEYFINETINLHKK